MKKYFRNRLCFPVKGFIRSIIYDLTRKDYFFIPNELFEIIDTNEIIYIENPEYLNFLLFHEFIHEIFDDRELLFFPPTVEIFETPYHIISLIMDIDSNLLMLKKKKYLINNLTIIIDVKKAQIVDEIKNILKLIEVESINLVFTSIDYFDKSIIDKLVIISEISLISVFKCKKKQNLNLSINTLMFFEEFDFYSKNVFPNKFSVNYNSFFESKNYNLYFNKKVYINREGMIFNGNLIQKINSHKSIDTFISSNEYINLNSSNKDNTLVCNVCEFRRMCVDSRVPTFNFETGNWFHKEECRYNPYLAKWENEEGYKNLENCNINISEKGELKILKIEELMTYINSIWYNE